MSGAVGSSLKDPRIQSTVHRSRVTGIARWVTLSSSRVPRVFSFFDLSVKKGCINIHTHRSKDGYRQNVLLPLRHSADFAYIRYVWLPPNFVQDNFTIFIVGIRQEILYKIANSVFLWLLICRLTRRTDWKNIWGKNAKKLSFKLTKKE